MSIVKLARITAYGHAEEKEAILADLQDMGCLHLIPLKAEEETLRRAGPSSESREALKFLTTCPTRWQQELEPTAFDAAKVEKKALELKRWIEELEDDRDFLRVRIRDMRPWGHFDFPTLEDVDELRLWFYKVPHQLMPAVEKLDAIWEVVSQDERFDYVVVLSKDEPEGMPVMRTRTGDKSLAELEARLRQVERRLESLQTRRATLTRWIALFTKSLYRLEDSVTLMRAAGQTHDDECVFALQAWAPKKDLERIKSYALDKGMALEVERPTKEEEPPTLLTNPKRLAGGQDLVTFYRTPNYWQWDPSIIVFFSFAVFFAMIIADAAYGCVLGAILGLLWRRMGGSPGGRRLRMLGLYLVGATIVYGVMVGSYFGITPAAGSFLDRFKVLDLNNFASMMKLSIIVGIVHLVVANALDFWRWRWSFGMLAPLGWMFMWVGAFVFWRGLEDKAHVLPLDTIGTGMVIAGMGLVLLFTTVRGSLLKRLTGGLLGLAKVSSAFGDTLSYLRLFALGLASASLAITFNDLARQVGDAVPGIGFLLSLLIILLGHGLNLLLAVASGVIHGLRLNFIEFFNWGLPDEGHSFRAFERKEKVTWTTSSSH